LQLGIPQTTVWRVVDKCLHLHAYEVNTAWTYYVPRKARMLTLFSILQYWF
jgi:hypothetical protein